MTSTSALTKEFLLLDPIHAWPVSWAILIQRYGPKPHCIKCSKRSTKPWNSSHTLTKSHHQFGSKWKGKEVEATSEYYTNVLTPFALCSTHTNNQVMTRHWGESHREPHELSRSPTTYARHSSDNLRNTWSQAMGNYSVNLFIFWLYIRHRTNTTCKSCFASPL